VLSSVAVSPIELLRTNGVAHEVHEHPPIRKYEDVQRVLGLPPEQLLKTMVFRTSEGRFLLVAVPVLHRVSYGKLARAAGVPRARLRQADAGDLALLGMEPGGAGPVCDGQDATVIFDAAVPGMGRVYCGSGRADLTIQVDAGDLLRLLRPTVAEVSERIPSAPPPPA
jgi:Cys-tRNA(Pro)/Cys-tRNA(Cys) deacylase